MHFIGTSAVLVIACVLAATGYSHHGHGGHSEEVGYSVVTKHEGGGHGGGHDGGHGGGHDAGHGGGHDAGHGGGYEVSYHGGHDDGGHDDGHGGGHHDDGHDHHAYPKYEFDYGVKDTKTGDIKSHSESRDGDNVKGSYTLKESDGTTRHVEYSSDKKKGFTAVVHKLGHAHSGDGGHGHGGHGEHGGHHGDASSYVVVKKHEEKKH